MAAFSYQMITQGLFIGSHMRGNKHSTTSQGPKHLLTNHDYHARMTLVSRKGNSDWWKDPAGNLLDEDYLGFIARYDIE